MVCSLRSEKSLKQEVASKSIGAATGEDVCGNSWPVVDSVDFESADSRPVDFEPADSEVALGAADSGTVVFGTLGSDAPQQLHRLIARRILKRCLVMSLPLAATPAS